MRPPSPHDALIDLLKQWPELALLAVALSSREAIPEYDELTVMSESTLPTQQSALRADLVLTLRLRGRVVRVVVVEVQLAIDASKPAALLGYLSSASRLHDAPVVVVMLTSSRKVERWANEPVSLGHPGLSFRPVVLGPSSVPRIDDVGQAIAKPALAVLSALAHASERGARALLPALLSALEALPAPTRELRPEIVDILMRTLEPDARQQLEVMMQRNYEFQSDYMKNLVSRSRAEGRVESAAEQVFAVLDARGLAVPEWVAERVRACRDLDELGRLVRKAVVASSADELFPGS